VINIKSTHPNPIFFKQQDNTEHLKVLQKDQDVTLSAGDSFGLLENELWYEIATNCGARTNENSQADSQVANFDDNTQTYTPPVMVKEEVAEQPEPSATEDTPPVAVEAAAAVPDVVPDVPPTPAESPPAAVPTRRIPAWMVTQSEAESSTKRSGEDSAEVETPKRIKVEDTSGPSTSGVNNNIPATTSAPVVVKTEPPDTNPKVASADSSTRRPTCNFGVRCYRKNNPIHRAAEAHPGDTDYRRPDFPPAPSDAPPCPYGASCYRRNPRHFLEFSHPDSSEF
jgi:aprataxin and PNK-like factor